MQNQIQFFYCAMKAKSSKLEFYTGIDIERERERVISI